jgi:hypothetical protein
MPRSSGEPASKGCVYPHSTATARPIRSELEALAANASECTSFYLDTIAGMSNDFGTEGEDHHQGLARSHQLSDGSIFFFLTHSEVDEGEQGSVSQYRYSGPTDGEHVLETSPLTVAPMEQLLKIDEQHPSEIEFLSDVNHADGGLSVRDRGVRPPACRGVSLGAVTGLGPAGAHLPGLPSRHSRRDPAQAGRRPRHPVRPELPLRRPSRRVLLPRDCERSLGLGPADARASDLFPGCKPGTMDVSAFKPAGMFPFPVLGRTGASQVKLVRDAEEKWFLLAFHSNPPDNPKGTDYVDLYGVEFEPFAISSLLDTVHVSFKPGDTGFASTGTHHVEKSGRLLLLSSYRWAKNERPEDVSYVSRVDELPSSSAAGGEAPPQPR